jgi:hypothetical protein
MSWELADASAIQALHRGDADADQQKRALKFIIEDICKTYDMSYRPDNPNDTTFAEGKRYVGNEIIRMIKMNLSALRRKDVA